MFQLNLSDKLADVLAWLVTKGTTFDYDVGDEIYFGTGRKIDLHEFEERCLIPEENTDEINEFNDPGSWLYRNPLFHDFLLNRPLSKITQGRTRSKNYRFIKINWLARAQKHAPLYTS